MRRSIPFTLAALVVASTGQPGRADHAIRPYAAWRWQRAIVPYTASPSAEQCAVLDASLFAGAAPGLRDVRLLQNGRELAYVIDESVDEHAGTGGVAGEDRSVYDTVAETNFSEARPDSPAERVATLLIPRRVPVERLRLIVAGGTDRPDVQSATQVTVTARPQAPAPASSEPEIVSLQAEPRQLSLPVTLGANLQHAAGVTVHVVPASATLTGVALEMRRREICYQPFNLSPITLLFGNANALPVHYDFGRIFKPKAAPLLSSMGPVYSNPAFYDVPKPQPGGSKRARLLVAILACAFALLLTVRALLRPGR